MTFGGFVPTGVMIFSLAVPPAVRTAIFMAILATIVVVIIHPFVVMLVPVFTSRCTVIMGVATALISPAVREPPILRIVPGWRPRIVPPINRQVSVQVPKTFMMYGSIDG